MSAVNARQFAVELARIAMDNRGEDVVALDMRGISPITDFAIICTGTSDRQIRAMADFMIEHGKRIGERPFGVAGYEAASWVVIDFVDVVVHVFSAHARAYYDLELLWGDAPRLTVARSETA